MGRSTEPLDLGGGENVGGGFVNEGREVLSFLPGEPIGRTNWPPSMRDGDGLAQLSALLLRRYHDVVADYRPPEEAVWHNPSVSRIGEDRASRRLHAIQHGVAGRQGQRRD
jgi:hypothetical protein